MKSYIAHVVQTLPPDQAEQVIAATRNAIGSISSIASLPPEIKSIVQSAFREGTRWAFISLLPWSIIAFISMLFISPIAQERLDKIQELETQMKEQREAREGPSQQPPLRWYERIFSLLTLGLYRVGRYFYYRRRAKVQSS